MSKSYRDLLVWQKSFNMCVDIYEKCQTLPETEKYNLISQITRCAVSIPSNIAEGQQRNSTKEFVHFLSIARGSAAELSTQLLLASKIYKIDIDALLHEVEEVQKMLFVLQKKLNRN